jgi:hypothetical protein
MMTPNGNLPSQQEGDAKKKPKPEDKEDEEDSEDE